LKPLGARRRDMARAGLIVLGLAGAAVAAVALPNLLKKSSSPPPPPPPPPPGAHTVTVPCPGCPEGSVLTRSTRYFVNDAAYQNLRNQGYTGYPIGPDSTFPGADGPAPATPVWGSYAARFVVEGAGGAPIGGRSQPVGTRTPGPLWNPPLPGYHDLSGATGALEDGSAVPMSPPGSSYAARFGLVSAGGPNPGAKDGVQSVATAMAGIDGDPTPDAFPWWSPEGMTGPLGYARAGQLDDAGGGYVSPGAYGAVDAGYSI
jgi:hypothetical protein